MSWLSTSWLKSQRRPHSSPCVSGHGGHLAQLRECPAARARRAPDPRRRTARRAPISLQHAHGVGEVEALVEVDAPVAVLADAFARLAAVLRRCGATTLAGVVDVADAARRPRPSGTRDSRPRWSARARSFRLSLRVGRHAGRTDAAGGVALAVVARRAAEQLVHGHAERLALDVPQRQVERAERVDLLAARRIEPGDVRLPARSRSMLERVLADQASRRTARACPSRRPRRCR